MGRGMTVANDHHRDIFVWKLHMYCYVWTKYSKSTVGCEKDYSLCKTYSAQIVLHINSTRDYWSDFPMFFGVAKLNNTRQTWWVLVSCCIWVPANTWHSSIVPMIGLIRVKHNISYSHKCDLKNIRLTNYSKLFIPICNDNSWFLVLYLSHVNLQGSIFLKPNTKPPRQSPSCSFTMTAALAQIEGPGLLPAEPLPLAWVYLRQSMPIPGCLPAHSGAGVPKQ